MSEMTATELRAQREVLSAGLKRLAHIQVSCGHCKHYELARCALHGDVPDEFVTKEHDCPDWRWDAVPF